MDAFCNVLCLHISSLIVENERLRYFKAKNFSYVINYWKMATSMRSTLQIFHFVLISCQADISICYHCKYIFERYLFVYICDICCYFIILQKKFHVMYLYKLVIRNHLNSWVGIQENSTDAKIPSILKNAVIFTFRWLYRRFRRLIFSPSIFVGCLWISLVYPRDVAANLHKSNGSKVFWGDLRYRHV